MAHGQNRGFCTAHGAQDAGGLRSSRLVLADPRAISRGGRLQLLLQGGLRGDLDVSFGCAGGSF